MNTNLFDYKNLIVKVNNINYNDLYNLLIICDNDFNPPLSSRVKITDYCNKLLKNAEIISLFYNDKLIGTSAIYCNNLINKEAFISVICILKEFRGLGLGNILIEKSKEIAKNNYFLRIKLEVDIKNTIAINLYRKHGFIPISKINENLIMQYDIQ